MSPTFKLYCDGCVQFVDARVARPVTFAHVTDLHLPGVPREDWPARYRHAIDWWNVEMGRPDRIVGDLLDRVGQAGVDFVFFGGDMLDYYHAGAAEHLIELCRQRGLRAHFQLGNHDYEDEYLRFVTHEFDDESFALNAGKLCEHWQMPGLNYTFDVGGVRFVSFTVEYKRVASSMGGVVTTAQADWLDEQLQFDGPIVIFHHIPFALPTIVPRLTQYWSGKLACIVQDDQGRHIHGAIAENPNVLGTFTGHAHMRSEDPFGNTWQFMTDAAHLGRWRYIRIAGERPPKSLNIAGEPTVENP